MTGSCQTQRSWKAKSGERISQGALSKRQEHTHLVVTFEGILQKHLAPPSNVNRLVRHLLPDFRDPLLFYRFLHQFSKRFNSLFEITGKFKARSIRMTSQRRENNKVGRNELLVILKHLRLVVLRQVKRHGISPLENCSTFPERLDCFRKELNFDPGEGAAFLNLVHLRFGGLVLILLELDGLFMVRETIVVLCSMATIES